MTITQQDLEELEKRYDNLVTTLYDGIGELIKGLEDQIESLDQQVATMLVGYLEQAAAIEALIHVLPQERIEEFQSYLRDRKQAMLSQLGDFAKGLIPEDDEDAVSGTGE